MDKEKLDMSLNSILVETFRTILKVEENMVRSSGRLNLSISEIHLLEAVSNAGENGATISEIAAALDIQLSSVTIAVNKLEKKGYVAKAKGVEDGRTVYVSLTPSGEKVSRVHSAFHKRMIRNITKNINEEEEKTMYKMLVNLNRYFRQSLSHLEAER
jgi:DNA-binding MarR family transcriptional regulator